VNTASAEELKAAFDLVERYHTGLTDFFPHEGVKTIGGSRMFISGPFFVVLKECVSDLRSALRKWSDVEARNVLDLLLAEAVDLLVRIEKEGRQGDPQRIDEAATLLYLANGTAWNYLREFATDEPPHNPQYVRVEPMLPLLKRCGRESNVESNADPRQLTQRLRVELSACLR